MSNTFNYCIDVFDIHYRRVYQGLLKLLDANMKNKRQESTSVAKKSRRIREISKLVAYIALGNEIKIEGD